MPSKSSLKIMLTDDDEDDRELFAEAISASLPDAVLTLTVNGNDLMKKLHGSDSLPDLLLLDMNMPLKNGKECLAEIRQNSRLSDIPVIIYSTSGNLEQINDMYEQGADYYIRKPSSFTALKDMVAFLGSLHWAGHRTPRRENFVLQGLKYEGK